MFRIATEPFIFLAFVSFGVYTSIVPQLLVSKVCLRVYNGTVCDQLSSAAYETEERHIHGHAMKWNSICFAMICVPSLLNIIIVGAISEVVSRRKLLLFPPIILAIQAVMLMLSAKFIESSLLYVAFASFMTSLYADIQGYVMVSYAYMADVTEPDQIRTIRMTVLGGLMYVAIGFSSFLSGIILKKYGFVAALSLSLVASVANFFFVAFILPETRNYLREENESPPRSALSETSKHFRAACARIVAFLKKYVFSWKNKHVALLLLTGLFTNAALPGENVILVLFLRHRPLALSSDRIGEYLLIQQCIRGIGVAILAVISLKLFKLSDPVVIVIGQISIVSTCVAIGLCKQWQVLFAVTPLALGYSLPSSGIRSLLTKMVEPHEHGTALSCVAFSSIVTWVFMTFGTNELFSLNAVLPGMSILLLAVLCFLGFLIGLLTFYAYHKHLGDSSQLLLNDKDEYETIL